MISELFHIGPISIYSYGVCMATGFLLAWTLAGRLCRKNGDDPDFLSPLITWIMVGSILGARIAYVLEHWTVEFQEYPMNVFRLDQGGLMFYGGFIGAALVIFLFSCVTKRKVFGITDLLLAVLPIGHAFGRVGCFLHGCCFGFRTDGVWGVCFPARSPAWAEQVKAGLLSMQATSSLPVLPTQLIEAAANLLLFAVLFTLYPRCCARRGVLTGMYLCGYSVIRFFMEYLRGDPRLPVGPFSIGQAISIGLFLLGAVILFLVSRMRQEPYVR
ncbi:MAG: prolipoprotein diacylglyceryl transferase [Kiritimatiellae bacterium]|nr:prolipoprotein diacylglyceryl transferase [Kiritimatiellia bacterium]